MLTFGVTVALTRLLSPEDFGIVALGLVFLTVFTSIQNFGVLSAVVQRDTRVNESISAALSLRWFIALALAASILVASPFISSFFGNPDLQYVLVAYTANVFVFPLGFSSQVLLIRNLRFSRIAVANIAQSVSYAAVSVCLALVGFTYWSMVIGTLSGSLAFVMVVKFFERTKMRTTIDLGLFKELLGFGKHLLVTSLMAVVAYNVDQLVVGKVLGVSVLGVYLIAVTFGRMVGRLVTDVANQVLFPTMARIKNDANRLKTAYKQSLRMIATITVPITVAVSALSALFVRTVLGDEWVAAIVPLSILSFQGLMNSLIPPAHNVLVSIGRLRYLSSIGVVHAVVVCVGVIPVAELYGLDGVCAFTTLLSCGLLIYYWLVFSGLFNESMLSVALPVLPQLGSGAVMYAFIFILIPFSGDTLLSLVLLSVLGLFAYAVSLHVLSRGKDVRDLLSLVRALVRGMVR